MSITKRRVVWVWLSALTVACGCVESQPVDRSKPFEVKELDACLAIVVDMSGSFAESWDGRAHKVFLDLMDRFFVDSAGGRSRVVIAQLSGEREAVLFEGAPADLRRRFQRPEDLSAFLKERSNPTSSEVFRSTRRTLDYVSNVQGVTERTRLLTVILSDMADTTSDLETRKREGSAMLDSLTRYREQGGGLALYFVGREEIDRWRRILKKAGFEPGQYVIESHLVEHPQLPRLD